MSIESLITLSNVLDVSTDYLLLDISNSADKKMINVINSLENAKKEKYDRLYNIIKILAEHIDEL